MKIKIVNPLNENDSFLVEDNYVYDFLLHINYTAMYEDILKRGWVTDRNAQEDNPFKSWYERKVFQEKMDQVLK